MTALLKPVIDNFSKYYIDKQKSPSYIQMYTKDDKEIILVYSKVNVSNTNRKVNNNFKS